MAEMTTENPQKNAKKYCCENCDYNTFKKNDYSRHLLTTKHKNNVLTTHDNKKTVNKYVCFLCEKKYNDRAGLWRHKNKCSEINKEKIIIKEDTTIDKDLIMMLIKQNSELLEVIKNGTHNTNSNNTNSLNKTFIEIIRKELKNNFINDLMSFQ